MKALVILVLIFTPTLGFAKKSSEKKVAQQSSRVTDANFTGTTVHGKYAHSPEAVVSVEQDKKLISVVKPRENFNFQIKQSQEERK